MIVVVEGDVEREVIEVGIPGPQGPPSGVSNAKVLIEEASAVFPAGILVTETPEEAETNAKGYADDADADHVAASDPHGDRAAAATDATTKADAAQAAAEAAAEGYADTKDSAHVAASDPHGDRANAASTFVPLSQRGAVLGVATLGADGLVPSAQIPPLAVHEFLGTVASQAAMLALTGQRGDVCIRSDFDPDRTYMLLTDDPTNVANWQFIGSFGGVQTVDGRSGVITLSDLYDAAGAAAAAQAASQPLDTDLTTIAALDSSQSGVISSDGSGWFRKTYAAVKTALGLTKSDVGLGNVDNTSDANKPVSTAQASAIAAAVAAIPADGPVTTPSLRTIGTGALQAAAGLDLAEVRLLRGVADMLRSPVANVGFQRVSTSKYRFLQEIAEGHWWSVDLADPGGFPGSLANHILLDHTASRPLLSVAAADGSIVHTGTWTDSVQSAAYGGHYKRSTTVNDDVTWTTPSGVTSVGLRTVVADNGGLAKVLIDGDATLANRLPTAQMLVDAGTFPNTILVANGGTLNPTDRVLDFYHRLAGSLVLYDFPVALADGLTAGVHTVKLVVTGYKRAAASAARVYSSGYTYATATTTLATTGAALVGASALMSDQSGQEYAWQFKPDAGSSYIFLGTVHGYELEDTLKFYLDGVEATALADGDFGTGYRTITAVKTSRLRHPDTGSTDIASITTVYRMTSEGLLVAHKTTWLVAGTIHEGYPAMLPLDGSFDKGSVAGAGTDYTLDLNDGSEVGKVKGSGAWLWQSAGQYAAMLEVPDVATSVNNWAASSPKYVYLQDRSPSTSDLSKIYVGRSQSPGETVAPGAVFRSRALYKVARLPQPDIVLGRSAVVAG